MMNNDAGLSQGMLDIPTSRAAMLRQKAVKLLAGHMLEDRLPRQVVLTCCLLFVWLEFLRNDFDAGLTHLKSGLRILLEMEQEQKQQLHAPVSYSGSVPTLQDVDGTISHMFTRLQIQAAIHGYPTSDFNSTPLRFPSEAIIEHIPQSFRGVAEARHWLDNIVIQVFQLIRQKQQFEASQGPAATLSPHWPLLIRARDSHLVRLEQWHRAFRNSEHLTHTPGADSPAIPLLGLNHAMAAMVMKNLFSESELTYDRYHADFERLLGLCEASLRHSRRETSGPVLSLDVGVLPCLFYVTLKCRDTAIRHRALHLLELAPEREGMWHRDSIIAAATWKVAMEEQWRDRAEPGKRQLPESARIYREKVIVAGTQRGPAKVKVRFGGGPPGSADVDWEVNRLLSRFGDMI